MGVSKGYWQNWQETAPGEKRVNQLLNTNCNKGHFNRLLKHVQKLIIQSLSAKSDTLSTLSPSLASAISASPKSR
jgi:hypothetical protein